MATGAVVLSASAVGAQATAQVSVSPNQGAPGSQFTITLANYHACPAGSPNCIIIDFVQSGVATRIGVADSHGAPSFAGNVSVPSAAKVGDATVRAHSTTDDANTAFTVTAPASSTTTTGAATTTTTTAATTTTSSSTTSTSTSTTEPPTTTTTVPPKKSSSHSDVPRYIAVALVVIAAAATAAVDTQLRRMKPPV